MILGTGFTVEADQPPGLLAGADCMSTFDMLLVRYGTDLDGLVVRLRVSVAWVKSILPDRPVTVRIEDLAADAITLNIGFWTDSLRSDSKGTTSSVRHHIYAFSIWFDSNRSGPRSRVVIRDAAKSAGMPFSRQSEATARASAGAIMMP